MILFTHYTDALLAFKGKGIDRNIKKKSHLHTLFGLVTELTTELSKYLAILIQYYYLLVEAQTETYLPFT